MTTARSAAHIDHYRAYDKFGSASADMTGEKLACEKNDKSSLQGIYAPWPVKVQP